MAKPDNFRWPRLINVDDLDCSRLMIKNRVPALSWVWPRVDVIPSELVHWATKHLSRVLNSNNPNLIFSPWLSLVTPETADQSERSGTNLQKTEPIIKRELHGQARCKGYGEDSSGGGPGLSCPLIGSPALLGMVIGWCVDIGNWAIWAT